jgi:hypothetical protein
LNIHVLSFLVASLLACAVVGGIVGLLEGNRLAGRLVVGGFVAV